MNTLRERLCEMIRADGRSQRQLAIAAGVSQPAVSLLLAGHRGESMSVEVLVKLARAMRVSPTKLGRLIYDSYAGVES